MGKDAMRVNNARIRFLFCGVSIVAIIASGRPTYAASPAQNEDATTPVPTCALLSIDRSALSTLLEAKLLAIEDANWLERNEIDNILEELKVQAFLSPEAVGERSKFGSLVRADLLVVVRHVKRPKDAQVQLIVCETTQGLRLCVESIPVSQDLDADATTLETFVHRAIQKHAEEIREICAVPPFVSDDLTYQYGYLKTAYAKLIERQLLHRKGLLVVEVAEANAIAQEHALADPLATVKRRLPLFVLGRYRNQDVEGDRRVTIELTVKRGDEQLGQVRQELLPPDEAAEFLGGTSLELVDQAVGATAPPLDAEKEAQQLAARARVFRRLGAWTEAIDLIEASLLLKPTQPELHRHAVIVLYELSMEQKRRNAVASAMLAHLRALEHVERYYLTAKGARDAGPLLRGAPFVRDVVQSTTVRAAHYHGRDEEKKKFVSNAKQRESDLLMRMVLMRGRAGHRDAAGYLARLLRYRPKEEAFRVKLDLIDKMKDLPNGKARARYFTSNIYTAGPVLNCPEGREYLEKLAAIPNKDIQAAVEAMRKDLAADIAQRAAMAKRPPPPDPKQNIDDDPKKVTFNTMQIFSQDEAGKKTELRGIVGCLPAAKGVDIIRTRNQLYLMKARGLVTPLYEHEDRYATIQHVAYDGRYVWAGVAQGSQTGMFASPGTAPLLVVIDSVDRKVWPITTEHGLPVEPLKNVRSYGQHMAVTHLEPGKACVCGHFGRTWIALVDFDPKGDTKVKVIHEARIPSNKHASGQWKSATMSFYPHYMHTLEGEPDANGKIPRRVLVGRYGGLLDNMKHPLIVDPEAETVKVMGPEVYAHIDPLHWDMHDGALYLVNYINSNYHLRRLAFPATKVETLARDVREGWLRICEGRIHVVGWYWWTMDGFDAPIHPLAKEVPWFYHLRDSKSYRQVGFTSTRPERGPNDDSFVSVWHSHHYGLLAVLNSRSSRGGRVVQAIPMSDEDAN